MDEVKCGQQQQPYCSSGPERSDMSTDVKKIKILSDGISEEHLGAEPELGPGNKIAPCFDRLVVIEHSPTSAAEREEMFGSRSQK